MKPNADLFKLVKSLNKNEKRYVTLFLSSGLYKNNKNSLLLFRMISKQDQFNDEVLKKKLSKSLSKRLSAEKNKLFDLILESMLFLYRDMIAERQVVRNRLRSWFFFQKGLRPLGWKYLEKSRELAEENELLPHLAHLAYLENFEMRVAPPEGAKFSTGTFYDRDEKILQKLSADLVLHTLYSEITELYKRFGKDGKLAEADIDRIMKNKYMDPGFKLTTFTSIMSRLEISALGYSMKDKHHEAFMCFSEQVQLIEKSEKTIHVNFGRYRHALINQMLHAVLMRDYGDLSPLIEKIKKSNEEMLRYFPWDIAYNEFVGTNFILTISLKNKADTVEGPLLLEKVEKGFVKYNGKLDDSFRAGVLYILGSYHFYLGNLKKSLHYFNTLIDSIDVETGLHFQCMARLVKLLLHYELGHYDLLPSLVQSASRLLKMKSMLGEFEIALLNFCRRSAKGVSRPELQTLLLAARKFAPAHYSYGSWCDFEFESWIESKLNGKSFAKTISEKQSKK